MTVIIQETQPKLDIYVLYNDFTINRNQTSNHCFKK